MNILIPHNWLLEHLDTSATPEEIQKYVSLSGPSVERINDVEGQKVYDIEITTNRVDAMSVRGVAREAAVILNQFGIKAKLKPLKLTRPAAPKSDLELPLPKITNDPKLCRRTICAVLRDVERIPTPEWMAERLKQTGQNVHDSVIDITNYITHELGHPVHAFDYDALMKASSGHIIITQAKKGKKFTTLDGNVFETVGGEVVFENPKGEIIDLPAIKGTANTSISANTKNVLLWIENLEPKLVRFASMTHAIRTVAAQLSEKNVDPHLAEVVLLRGIELYQELCHAKIGSAIDDVFPGKRHPAAVKLPLSRVAEYLGLEIPFKHISEALESLGCELSLARGVLSVKPPTFRPDLTIPADIIEEIARIYGYHKLPSKIMDTPIPLTKPAGVDFRVEQRIKRFLAALGWQEVYTYSMVSEAVALESGHTLGDHLKLANPLTDDRMYLRRSLVPSLEEVIAQNPLRKSLSVFEIAHVYEPVKGALPNQDLHLCLVSTQSYRQVRGALEALLGQFFLKEVSISPGGVVNVPAPGKPGKTAGLGTIGVTKSGHITVVLELAHVLAVVATHPTYEPTPKSTALVEDMTFAVKPGVAMGSVMQTIKNVSPYIKAVELKDIYKQNATFSIVYLNPEAEVSFSSDQVEPMRKQIAHDVAAEGQGALVGVV